MKQQKLFSSGHELVLEKRVGRGGEGEVFSLSNLPGFALKAYFPHLLADREKKIHAMIGADFAKRSPMVAFPHQIVVDQHGAFAGFLMRLVEKHKEIHELQTPSSRHRHFPSADYGFIVRVALNVARVFAQVHATGCVIGDINQRGILVSPNATVAMIDADSFQISDGAALHFCSVGVPEYTPPELQGKTLSSTIRTIDHDAFGLAICLFQLLCMDRHPFSGRPRHKGEMPLEKAIAEYRFAYSSRDTGMSPPPGTVQLSDFPADVVRLFEEAFSPAHRGKRPSALKWIEALGNLETSLRTCSYSKQHRYSRAAKECPWCRMEAEYGRPVFVDINATSIHLPNGRIDPSVGLILDISALLSPVNAISVPSSVAVSFPTAAGTIAPSQAIRDYQDKRQGRVVVKYIGWVLLLAAAFTFLSGMSPLIAIGIAALGIWASLGSAAALGKDSGILAERSKIAIKITSRIETLQRDAPVEQIVRKKAEILDIIDEYKASTVRFGNVKRDYEEHRRSRQLDAHLAQFAIRSARITKVSSSNVAQLASFGFTTALDVKRRDVLQVHGIGPVKAAAIAAWLASVETQFRFTSSYSADEQRAIKKAQGEIVTKQQGLEERIKTAIAELQQESKRFERWKALPDPELRRLTDSLAQIDADLRFIGKQLPPIAYPTPRTVPNVSAFRSAALGVVKTPGSGQQSKIWGSSASAATGSTPPIPSNPASSLPSTASIIARSVPTQQYGLSCPRCGSAMRRRTARQGRNFGKPFWGCARFPSCKGTLPI